MTSDEDVETIATLKKQKIAISAELRVYIAEADKLRELLSKEKMKNLEVLSNIDATSSMMHKKEIEVLQINHAQRIQNLQTSFDERLETFKNTSQSIIDELKIQNASLHERLKATTPPLIPDQEIKTKLDMTIHQHEEEKKSLLIEAKKCAEMISKLQIDVDDNNKLISSLESKDHSK